MNCWSCRATTIAPPVEFLAARLRQALDELGMLIGRVTPDDVLDQVFANFCVGK